MIKSIYGDYPSVGADENIILVQCTRCHKVKSVIVNKNEDFDSLPESDRIHRHRWFDDGKEYAWLEDGILSREEYEDRLGISGFKNSKENN